jgi:hypothetical protein
VGGLDAYRAERPKAESPRSQAPTHPQAGPDARALREGEGADPQFGQAVGGVTPVRPKVSGVAVLIRLGGIPDVDAAVSEYERSNLARRQGVWPDERIG